MFAVQVRCALRHRQEIVPVRVTPGETVADAVQRSAILASFPQIDPARVSFAIHGARVEPDRTLQPDDRIDVLRPLAVDPKQARRRRARKIAGGATE